MARGGMPYWQRRRDHGPFQIAILNLAKHPLGSDDDIFCTILVTLTRAVTSKDIDRAGFAPLELIRQLWCEIHHATAVNEKALAARLLTYLMVAAIGCVTAAMAAPIITARMGRKARARSKAGS